jgi:hypothetical protein
MNKFTALLPLVFILCGHTSTHAQTQKIRDWKVYANTTIGQYFYDPASIKGDLNDLKMQVKVNLTGEIKDGIKSRMIDYSLNCREKTVLVETLRIYTEPDLAGIELVRSNPYGTEKRVAQANSQANATLDAACNAKSAALAQAPTTQAPQATQAPQVPRAAAFKYVNKMSPDEINALLLLKTWDKELLDNFLLNYSFIYYIHKRMFAIGGPYDYLNIPHREAMRPFQANINKSLQDMDSVIANIAKAVQVQPSVIYKAFGIELEKEGILKETDIKSISTGRLLSDDYWMRFPDKQRSVNDWYDARDPAFLFGEFYPGYAASRNRDVAKLSKHAALYENKQLDEAKKREEREQWLQTAEGKKHLADEEAKRKREEQDRQRAEAAEAARIAKEFPFFAEVTCNNGGYGNFQIHACFTGSKDVQFEVHNGSDYHFYALPDIFNLSARSGRSSEAIINLRNKFQIKMQNAGGDWILGLRVIKRQTGEVVFQKKVSGFGVISVKN